MVMAHNQCHWKKINFGHFNFNTKSRVKSLLTVLTVLTLLKIFRMLTMLTMLTVLRLLIMFCGNVEAI